MWLIFFPISRDWIGLFLAVRNIHFKRQIDLLSLFSFLWKRFYFIFFRALHWSSPIIRREIVPLRIFVAFVCLFCSALLCRFLCLVFHLDCFLLSVLVVVMHPRRLSVCLPTFPVYR